MSRIAVIGSGISGTGSAWLLSQHHTVDVYEAEKTLGGHACTIDLTVDGHTFPADAGFMVFNQRTYPNLIRFFERLGVAHKDSDMSFSVQIAEEDIEWSGTNLDTVFAQRKNLANPRFLKMLADVVRFSHDAERLLADPSLEQLTLGQMLEREGYSGGFTDWYLIPMGDAIWSTPPGKMLEYPAASFLRFCNNHGLLHITGKPMWMSVIGGSRTYVHAAARTFSGEVHTEEPAERIERTATGVRVHTARRTERYDTVIVATHAPDTLALLGDGALPAERDVLSAFEYQPNEITLHTDASFLPKQRRAWASWNWYAEGGESSKDMLALTYLLNNLQELPGDMRPVMETLNPHRAYAQGTVLHEMTFQHPLFTEAAIAAQHALGSIQGIGGVWYTGAWQRYGFHEDGLLSAVRVSESLGAHLPWGEELDETRTAERVSDAAAAKRRFIPGTQGAPGFEPNLDQAD